MKQEIKYTHPSKTSRYKKLTVFLDETNLFMSAPKYIEIPIHEDDNYFSVTPRYVNRLDLIAHKFYHESKLWWAIAIANDLEDPMNIPLDTILRIPAVSTLFGSGGVIGDG